MNARNDDDAAIWKRCVKTRIKACALLRSSVLETILATVDSDKESGGEDSKVTRKRLLARIYLHHERFYRSASDTKRDPTLRRNDLQTLRSLRSRIDNALKDPSNLKPLQSSKESSRARRENTKNTSKQAAAAGTSTEKEGSKSASTSTIPSTFSSVQDKNDSQGSSSGVQMDQSTGGKAAPKRKRVWDVSGGSQEKRATSGTLKPSGSETSAQQQQPATVQGHSNSDRENQPKKQRTSKPVSTSLLANAAAATSEFAAGSVDDGLPQQKPSAKHNQTSVPACFLPPPYEKRSALGTQDINGNAPSSESRNRGNPSASSSKIARADSGHQQRRPSQSEDRTAGNNPNAIYDHHRNNPLITNNGMVSSSTMANKQMRSSPPDNRNVGSSHATQAPNASRQVDGRVQSRGSEDDVQPLNAFHGNSWIRGNTQANGTTSQGPSQPRPSAQHIDRNQPATSQEANHVRTNPSANLANRNQAARMPSAERNSSKSNGRAADDLTTTARELEERSRIAMSSREPARDANETIPQQDVSLEIAKQEHAAKRTPNGFLLPPETEPVKGDNRNWEHFPEETRIPGNDSAPFSTIRADRPELKATFHRETPLENLRLGTDRLFRLWEPFWHSQKNILTGVTVKIQECDFYAGKPKKSKKVWNVPRTAASFKLPTARIGPFGCDLQFGKSLVGQRRKDGDCALMLRMLPIEKDKKSKRAPTHLWPKGTFLTINGKPQPLVQRKQASHDPEKWEYNCAPLDLAPFMKSPKDDITVAMCCQDAGQFVFSVSICCYKTPPTLLRELLVPGNPFLKTLTPEQSLKKAMAYIQVNSMISIDSDDNGANGQREEMGRLVFSLLDPGSKTTIKTPVRGRTCKHWQCFDLGSFLELNQPISGGRWRCLCCESFVSYQDLELCGLTQESLKQWEGLLSSNRNTVELRADKSYTLLPATRKKNQNRRRGSKTSQDSSTQDPPTSPIPKTLNEPIELIDDSD